ncbi:hypothetical protein PWT90_10696 [Aphanocladium album]|nr:hypothetical protein PWT90_10696 [Aphanocladium album]
MELTIISLDHGSSGIRACQRSPTDDEPHTIAFGYTHGADGQLVHADKFPTWVQFGRDSDSQRGVFSLLGNNPVEDYSITSCGVKQSLDDALCQVGSEGYFFRGLCRTHGIDADDKHLRDSGLPDHGWRLQMCVPVIWTLGDAAKPMQAKIRHLARRAGFPSNMAFDTEPAAIHAYAIKYPDRFQSLPSTARLGQQELHIDLGACTADFAPRVKSDQYTLLSGDASSCAAGMADVWRRLYTLCSSKHPSYTYYEAARQHIYRLSDTSSDFIRDGQTITQNELRDLITQGFVPALNMFKDVIRRLPHLSDVIVSGMAPVSNAFIREWLQDRMREELQATNLSASVRFIGSDHAGNAVSIGAALPFSENPVARFWQWPFGFLCRAMCTRKACLAGRYACDHERQYIQQVKARRSMNLSPHWESLETQERALIVEPHAVVHARTSRKKSSDTFNSSWAMTDAVPLAKIAVDLRPHLESDGLVWLRFCWEDKPDNNAHQSTSDLAPEQPPTLRLEVSLSSHARDTVATQILALYADRDGLSLSPVSGATSLVPVTPHRRHHSVDLGASANDDSSPISPAPRLLHLYELPETPRRTASSVPASPALKRRSGSVPLTYGRRPSWRRDGGV